MTLNLATNRDEIAAKLKGNQRILLFSDFDGTLTPIKDRPADCFLESAVRTTLQTLAAEPRVAVGVVSGRELTDLRFRVGLTNIAYAGNHGLEIEGPGFSFLEPTAVSRRSELNQLLRELGAALANFAGVWIQDKQWSASIHYRQAKPEILPELLAIVQQIVAPAVAANRFVLRPGKMVVELRPAVDWHKGKAVLWLANKLAAGQQQPVVIYLGDDATDEDAFRELPEGITIAIGEMQDTAAKYSLPNPAAVAAFLQWLLDTIIQ